MQTLDLSGTWNLTDHQDHQCPAQVPGSAVGALITAGALADPLIDRNESAAYWVDERRWTWERSFDLPAGFLDHDRVELVAEGLDVLTSVRVGNHVLARTANRFRTWRWDVRKLLRDGARTLAVDTEPSLPELRRRRAERDLYGLPHPDESLPTGWLRTAACQFGWDWGVRVAGCALRGRICLAAWSIARLDDVQIIQHHQAGQVEIALRIAARRARPDPVHAEVTVEFAGRIVANLPVALDGDAGTARLSIPDAQLWWPNGLGAQPLYTVTVVLRSEGRELDQRRQRIGLRKVDLDRRRDETGETFGFVVNGVPCFARGANWVPPHPIPERVDPLLRGRFFDAMTRAHFNMLRIWGGGVYEDDAFYERCDELGILVWQDLMMACAHVPLHDAAWTDDLLHEIEDQVQRLRHHPCLALWCGNNEFEMGGISWDAGDMRMDWDDYIRLFDRRIPELIGRLDPQRAWWPCSPTTPLGDRADFNHADSGDVHAWDVWVKGDPLDSASQNTPRFVSEFGFQSFAELPTLAAAMPADQIAIGHAGFEHRQRGGPTATARILTAVREWLPLPTQPDLLARATQLAQGIYLDVNIRAWRRSGRCRGTLYWQIDDTWPCLSWSTVDHRGVWKLSHAQVARAFAPQALCTAVDAAKGAVDVHVVNDLRQPCHGELVWRAIALSDGRTLRQGVFAVTAPALSAAPVGRIEVDDLRQSFGAAGFVVCMALATAQGTATSEAWFARPAALATGDPGVSVEVAGDGGITVRSKRPAPLVWVEADGSLLADTGQGRLVLPDAPWHLDARAPRGARITVRSLADLAAGQARALGGKSP
jgi:beta-mannosidase